VRGPGAYTEPGAVYAHLRGAMMGDTIIGLICLALLIVYIAAASIGD
jgi:hypothetical protein